MQSEGNMSKRHVNPFWLIVLDALTAKKKTYFNILKK
jgi:hypothetical protein